MEQDTLDEKAGYFYEALLSFVIRTKCATAPHFEMHKKLTAHSVVSDVIIPNALSPQAVILCTHSQSEKGTAMKTWRNIDEMLLIRENFAECKIINLIFPSKWKRELISLMGAISDLQIIFPEDLIPRVYALAKFAIKQKIKSAESYFTWLSSLPNEQLEDVCNYLGKAIDFALSDKCKIRPEWDNFSSTVSKQKTTIVHVSGDSLWKKGCGKLALLDSSTRNRFLECNGNISALTPKERDLLTYAGVIHHRISIQNELLVDDCINYVLQHDRSSIDATFNLIQQYHASDLSELTTMVSPNNSLSLKDFVDNIPFENSKQQSMYFYNHLADWRDNHSGKRNLPLSYLYVLARTVDKKFSHEYLSAYCQLPMIGGISPIPLFLYGKKELPDHIVLDIANCFVDIFHEKTIPTYNTLHAQMLYETEDKLIKHRYVNTLLYAAIGKCLDAGLTVEHPQHPEVLIGNEIAHYCARTNKISSGTAQTHFSFEIIYKGHQFVFLVIAAYAATHKHKEYPARWRCSNIVFDSGFSYSQTNKHWIVILDGVWSTLFKDFSDLLDKFSGAGAEAIFDIGSFLRQKDLKKLLSGMIPEDID